MENTEITYNHEEYMINLKNDLAIQHSLDLKEFDILDDFSPEAEKLYDDLSKKIELKWQFKNK
ncbi:hypothetical protein [Mycoplasma miroungirhinis]|uniref:Uncharacterized protein n=1 Tax=Mycoplasma miroungirhinis TaxID=754516 RepID=A0A6M4JFY8_9MOLU|nr:hypothetical protein [Mycoplasma miroungirhinis]QJR43942.1 hypothetical protein HLA92_00570 [Mycoplasma miroungirhinis]